MFHCLEYLLGLVPLEKEEVRRGTRIQSRHLAPTDSVGVGHDETAGSLAEDVFESQYRNSPRVDEICEHPSWTYGRQLVDVADQYKTTANG